MAFISIYITHPDRACAKNIANALLQKKWIACANIFPIDSMYSWENKQVEEKEWVSLVKTRPALFEKIVEFVEENHPYDVPCIMRQEVLANPDYEKWIYSETENV